METKPFPTADVMTVATGIKLADDADFHSVMDHLFPGIMTIVCAAMQPRAAQELKRQHPKISEIMRIESPKNYGAFLSLATVCFGDTLAVSGPIEVSDDEVQAAFDALAGK